MALQVDRMIPTINSFPGDKLISGALSPKDLTVPKSPKIYKMNVAYKIPEGTE